MRVAVDLSGPGLADASAWAPTLRHARRQRARRVRSRPPRARLRPARAADRRPRREAARDAVQPAGDLHDESGALRAVGDAPQPVVSAGHSLRRVLQFGRSRDRWSSTRRCASSTNAAERCRTRPSSTPARMSAVLGLEASAVRAVVDRVRAETRATRAAGQLQLTDADRDQRRRRAVRAAGEAMLAAGAKRVVPLNVSGAWHSELMQPAVERFAARRRARALSMPRVRRRFERRRAAVPRRRGHSAKSRALDRSTKCAGTTPPNVCCRTISTSSSSSARARCSVR